MDMIYRLCNAVSHLEVEANRKEPAARDKVAIHTIVYYVIEECCSI